MDNSLHSSYSYDVVRACIESINGFAAKWLLVAVGRRQCLRFEWLFYPILSCLQRRANIVAYILGVGGKDTTTNPMN